MESIQVTEGDGFLTLCSLQLEEVLLLAATW